MKERAPDVRCVTGIQNGGEGMGDKGKNLAQEREKGTDATVRKDCKASLPIDKIKESRQFLSLEAAVRGSGVGKGPTIHDAKSRLTKRNKISLMRLEVER